MEVKDLTSDKFIFEDPDLAEEIPVELLQKDVIITENEVSSNPILILKV
jgi:hypothetical protein